MWENYIREINSTLLRFSKKESPELPTYYDIQELVALGKDGTESSLILSHLFYALNNLRENFSDHFDPDHWNETKDYDWLDTEFFGHFDLYNNLDLLFKEVKIIGSPLTFEMYINRYCVDSQENQNSNPDNAPPRNTNKFNKMPIEEVRDHFKPLIEKKNKSGQIWMSNDDFEIFIKRSFESKINLSKPKINIGSKGKYALVQLFHNFYSKTLDHPYNNPREIDKVYNLLKDAFDTPIFDDLRKDNFKNSKSKFDWD